MSQVEYYPVERRGWWERVCDSLTSRRPADEPLDLPADSLFANGIQASRSSVADVPESVKAVIREEAVLDTFNRLEASLRLLLFATAPGKEPPSAERCRQILQVWRYELEHSVKLRPDTYCGAVQRYEAEMEKDYIIDGRCEPGDLLRIRVPCWRMHNRIVVRGEAEAVRSEGSGETLAQSTPDSGAPKYPVLSPQAIALEGDFASLRATSDDMWSLEPQSEPTDK